MPSTEELLSVADLFSLTHGSVASSSTSNASPSAVPEAASLSEDTATLLSHVLVTAHAARRTGNHEASYESYQQLAEHFTSNNQLSNATFFYERCLLVSKEHDWIEGQTAAHTNLGVYPLQASSPQDIAKVLQERTSTSAQTLQPDRKRVCLRHIIMAWPAHVKVPVGTVLSHSMKAEGAAVSGIVSLT